MRLDLRLQQPQPRRELLGLERAAAQLGRARSLVGCLRAQVEHVARDEDTGRAEPRGEDKHHVERAFAGGRGSHRVAHERRSAGGHHCGEDRHSDVLATGAPRRIEHEKGRDEHRDARYQEHRQAREPGERELGRAAADHAVRGRERPFERLQRAEAAYQR